MVFAHDGSTALVSNYGGSRPTKDDKTEDSAGSAVAVDDRGIALRGTVSVIDLKAMKTVGEIATRIHPEAMALSPDGKLAYVIDDSGDGVSVIDVASALSSANWIPSLQPICLRQPDQRPGVERGWQQLYLANAGNNAIAVMDLQSTRPATSRFFIPAGGFPGSICLHGNDLFIGNVIGYYGGLQKVALPAADDARGDDAESERRLPFRRNCPRPGRGGERRPPAARAGSYGRAIDDQARGLRHQGKQEIRPGARRYRPRQQRSAAVRVSPLVDPQCEALADQFVLLDNYYCNGVRSSDGHQWAVQGITSAYREKDWESVRCTYDFGVDPLCYARSGFIWDHLLRQGVSFRNFGELDYPVNTRGRSWSDFYQSWKKGGQQAGFRCQYYIDSLRRYSDLRFPGWEMAIPDQSRADAFLTALREFEKAGTMPDFVIVYLPNDHTQGNTKNAPTPRAYVADNDLALGRIIEGLSRSRFWHNMAIFVNEDDPQSGTDHVDGHRSICFLAGPNVKRSAVVSHFYNQDSVLHTICRIFGAPPMNQLMAIAPVMDECFQDPPDFSPYACVPETVPLDEMNPGSKVAGIEAGRDAPPAGAISKTQAALAPLLAGCDYSKPDQLGKKADVFSRYEWSTIRGDEPFPAEYFGNHGKGLKPLGLALAPEDDDD